MPKLWLTVRCRSVCPVIGSLHLWLPRVLVEPASHQSPVVQKIEFPDIQVSCACNRRELKPELHVSLPHPFGAGSPKWVGPPWRQDQKLAALVGWLAPTGDVTL